MESIDDEKVVPPVSIMANHDGPSLVRTVEGNLPGLALKAAANLLDARAAVPPQHGSLANPICRSADPNKRFCLTEACSPRSEQEEGQGGYGADLWSQSPGTRPSMAATSPAGTVGENR